MTGAFAASRHRGMLLAVLTSCWLTASLQVACAQGVRMHGWAHNPPVKVGSALDATAQIPMHRSHFYTAQLVHAAASAPMLQTQNLRVPENVCFLRAYMQIMLSHVENRIKKSHMHACKQAIAYPF